MKKFYLTLVGLCLAPALFAQNLILFEDFEGNLDYIVEGLPTGNDITWINADYDGLDDESGGSRPGAWFLTDAFADADAGNTVMASNSWTESTDPVFNFLILPPIKLDAADGMVYWKHAPFQTPRYVDGMQVLVSTTGNDQLNFLDTLKVYAEMTQLPTGTDTIGFENYQFSEGFVFGLDGEYIEDGGDSSRFRGILRPDSASLAQYSGQTIYIAFCHGTVDDNMISVDEIQVTGTGLALAAGTTEKLQTALTVFPNPANEKFRVSYANVKAGTVRLNLFDVTGKLVKPISNSGQISGNYYFDVDTRDLASGVYNAVLENASGKQTVKVTVQR